MIQSIRVKIHTCQPALHKMHGTTRHQTICTVKSHSRPLATLKIWYYCVSEVAGVAFSDSDFAPVPKFLNPGPDPAIFQIWKSDSCSNSGYNHRSNRNLPKPPHRLLLLLKLKSDSGSGSAFSQIFDSGSGSGSERKTQNPTGVDSGTPDPDPPLLCMYSTS